jgi:hypothetical protein
MKSSLSAVFIAILMASLAACAVQPSGRDSVLVATAYAGTGVAWIDGYGIAATEIDGRADTYRWTPGGEALSSAAWSLRHCLDYSRIFRASGRSSPPGWVEPNLVHTEVERCIVKAGLPPADKQPYTAPAIFDVWLGVDTASTNLASGGGNPIWSAGGSGLGAALVLSGTPAINLPAVSADAARCRDLAAGDGVLHSYESPPPSSSSSISYIKTRSVSIEAMVGRFEACLRQIGYTVSAPPKRDF